MWPVKWVAMWGDPSGLCTPLSCSTLVMACPPKIVLWRSNPETEFWAKLDCMPRGPSLEPSMCFLFQLWVCENTKLAATVRIPWNRLSPLHAQSFGNFGREQISRGINCACPLPSYMEYHLRNELGWRCDMPSAWTQFRSPSCFLTWKLWHSHIVSNLTGMSHFSPPIPSFSSWCV